MTAIIPCPACAGSGVVSGACCPVCHGMGKVVPGATLRGRDFGTRVRSDEVAP